MTLGTHIVVGVAVAELFAINPTVAFAAALASHYLLDAIPHWDYKILSEYANPEFASAGKNEPNRLFRMDLLRTGSDALLGLCIALLLWQSQSVSQWGIVALGAIGGVLPDFLQFVYARFPHQPMVALQKFHKFIHAKIKLSDKPVIGIISQVVLVVCVILLAKYLVQF